MDGFLNLGYDLIPGQTCYPSLQYKFTFLYHSYNPSSSKRCIDISKNPLFNTCIYHSKYHIPGHRLSKQLGVDNLISKMSLHDIGKLLRFFR